MGGGIKIKTVFFSHPFRGDEQENDKKVDKICKNILKDTEDILPLSPLHLFSFMSANPVYESLIMSVCFNMIDIADEVWFFKYGELSEGQIQELEYAKSKDKLITIIEMR